MRKMGPLKKDHPLVTEKEKCPACRVEFKTDDFVTLISLGPGDDTEARQRARHDEAYNAVAVPVHWACATGEE